MTPAASVKLSPAQPGMSPWKVIQTYEPNEWEEFIREWAEGFNPPYTQVVPLGGAGDKGRDVVAYDGDPTSSTTPWDSYQCKHYDHALAPADIYTELGKLCVFTWKGDYTVPRKYRFASPLGVGTKLHDLLKKPDDLRKELITNWDAHCKDKISSAESFPLVKKLKSYVTSFDFSIVWFETPQQILDQHQRTKHWHRRFKIEPPPRPEPPPPPDGLQPNEGRYVVCLLGAYGDRLGRVVAAVADIEQVPMMHSHFKKSRGHFFSAEALFRFSREQFTQQAFDKIKDHIHDGVGGLALATYKDAFECVVAVCNGAVQLKLPASDLEPYVGPADRIGLCHHLTNDGKLSWTDHARITETK